MSALLPGLRRTVRSLLRQPGFTLAAVGTLALALGANTAIFRLVDAVLLTPPPFRDPGRIMVIWHRNPEVARILASEDLPATPATIFDWQRDSRSFDLLADLLRPQRLSKARQTAAIFSGLTVPTKWRSCLLVDGLDLIQIDDRVVLEPFVDPDQDFTGRPMRGGRDRCYEDGAEEADRLLARQHQHGTALVG
jgi:hypothetical protein